MQDCVTGHVGEPHELGYQPDCPPCEAAPDSRIVTRHDGRTEYVFRTAAIIVHHDAGVVETFASDTQTTHADWARACKVLKGLGAKLAGEYIEDEGWMITTGTF